MTSLPMFTDSAVDVYSAYTTEDNTCETSPAPLAPNMGITLSEYLTHLAATAWAVEQDGNLKRNQIDSLMSTMQAVEAKIQRGRDGSELSSADESSEEEESTSNDEKKTDNLDDLDDEASFDHAQLQAIRNSLSDTVTAMRLRQEEQHHLHKLTIHRLEDVAQTCLVQEQELRNLVAEVQMLRKENRTLGQENDQLREQVSIIEAEKAQKEVAVNAMSSAVTGLEGWINLPREKSRSPFHSPPPNMTPAKTVVRGRGRFRAKYHVDETGTYSKADPLESTADADELHDGIKAWLRGFRDVEEELNRSASARSSIRSRQGRTEDISIDDDWGEFEAVSTTA